MKFIIFFITLILFSCNKSREADNEYFHSIALRMQKVIDDGAAVQAEYLLEKRKYADTHNRKYLIAAQYIQTFKYQNDREKLIPIFYDLLKLNNDEYSFVSVSCNYGLALIFEHNSPALAESFIQKAIKMDEKSDKHLYRPHLYHLKGRFHYNKKEYNEALRYFQLAMRNFNQSDVMYKASMYNNYALVYDQLGKVDQAKTYFNSALHLFSNQKKYFYDEITFLNRLKLNLANHYIKMRSYAEAEKLLNDASVYYSKTQLLQTDLIETYSAISEVYRNLNQKDKLSNLTEVLLVLEPKLTKINDKIALTELLQKIYLHNSDSYLVQKTTAKLVILHKQNNLEAAKTLSNIYNIYNRKVIEDLNEKYDRKSDADRLRQFFLISVLILVIGISFLLIRTAILKQRTIAQKNASEKIILLKDKKILEQDNNIQKEKIKNLHQNLSLKTATEKAFLENLKKIRKNKTLDTEQVIKDLFLQVSNLIQIDNRNIDISIESHTENENFKKKISSQFPSLTEKELKLCIFFRLNLSSKEISALEDSTPGTVRVYKTKIKTKMGLDRDTDLSKFLNAV